ncbi:MAG: hypothetical protein KKG70_17660 [Proteobacteria bacterium]|nr:hypothetical protein [Pseudomonadota bacterium]
MINSFTPDKFKHIPPNIFGSGTLSKMYWDFAQEFYLISEQEFKNGSLYSNYVIPAIIFYCSCVEANINEQLAIQEGFVHDCEEKNKIFSLKKEGLKKKVKLSFEMFRQCAKKEHINKTIIDDFLALAEVRNAFVHFKPDWDSNLFNWPMRLKAAFQKSEIDPKVADWTVVFCSKIFIDWTRDKTKSILIKFFGITGQDKNDFFKENRKE